MKMKKAAAALLAAGTLTALLSACQGGQAGEEKTELVVFAAASMTETLTELGDAYMKEHEDIVLTFNFESSGTLQTQIEEGAVCDIFISAAQTQMDALDNVLESSRFDILENKVALAVPEGNPGGIESYEDLCAGLETGDILLAMGGADVPVGQYTQKILTWLGLDEGVLAQSGCITYGSNVKEVTSQVSEAAVDCGIIYQTDAYSAGLTVVDTATEEMCGQVIYPAAVLESSEHIEQAEAFLEYLKGDEADAVFSAVGFTPIA